MQSYARLTNRLREALVALGFAASWATASCLQGVGALVAQLGMEPLLV